MAHRPKIDNSVKEPRSNQNLSCNWTGTTDFGRLTPFHWEELLPGDHVIHCKPRTEMLCLPLASPTFGKVDLYMHYFLVPLRQLDDHFYDKWSRTGVNKDLTFSCLNPLLLHDMYNRPDGGQLPAAKKRALYKHWTSLGLPPFFHETFRSDFVGDVTPISYYPFAAYNKIWWDFYRDPELIRDESISNYLFTGEVPDDEDGEYYANFCDKFLFPHLRTIKNNWISDLYAQNMIDKPLGEFGFLPYNGSDDDRTYLDEDGNYFARVQGGEIVKSDDTTSQQIRIIEALTRLSERLSLSGKRQIEALFARYGIKPKWSEINLCRYVGGAKQTVMINDIISTSDTTDANENLGLPLGAQAGKGYCSLAELDINVSVDEPSILMGIVSVMPHVHYVQGLSKKWQRRYFQDFFQNSLQYVGNVAVSKREVGYRQTNIDYNSSYDGGVFAFTDPYYEYKMGLDVLAGDFMRYHQLNIDQVGSPSEELALQYMQSMEQYIDFPIDRLFKADNLVIDGDQFNKIFTYLGGSLYSDADDHFHLCIDKDVLVSRPMEGFAIPTLETTSDPHQKTTPISEDKML